ncbi:MAG TPA: MBL fold metallo-hydrolase [Bacteroidetes bacterium]|nr:MBL fold metallo-hydrolase [Bacteroidota bacterium]
MKVVIWGSRGSLPASVRADIIREKIFKALFMAKDHHLVTPEAINQFIDTQLPFSVRGGYGTNTSCIEIRNGDDFIICDAGSGIRDFGNYVMKSGKTNCHFHIFMSHLHWDHIMGFPFFVPAFIPSNQIDFYGFHPELKDAFINQQNAPHFPVALDYMQAEKRFSLLQPEQTYEISGFRVTGFEQSHPGVSYGFCFEKDGKKIVYSTDSENKEDSYNENYHLLQFYKNADLLIFDTQYSLEDTMYSKQEWGHSSNIKGVDLAVRAGVKHLCMYHSEPTASDEILDDVLRETKDFAMAYAYASPLKVSLAYDGQEIEV